MADEHFSGSAPDQQTEEPSERRRSRRFAVLIFVALFVVAALSLIFREEGGSKVSADRLQIEIQELLIKNPTGFDIRLEKQDVAVPTSIVQDWFGDLPSADKVTGVRGAYDALYHLSSSWDWSRETDGKTLVVVPVPEFVSASLRPGDFSLEPPGLTLEASEESGLKQSALQSLSVYIEQQEEAGLAKERRNTLREKVAAIITTAVPGSEDQLLIAFPDEAASDDGNAEP